MDTIGSLIDKLATVNNKMFVNQELLYKIRKMDRSDFVALHFEAPEKLEELYDSIKKCCDLNYQRACLKDEIDRELVNLIRELIHDPAYEMGVFNEHKTY